MNRVGRVWIRVGLCGCIALAAQGCQEEEVPVQELFALRNQGLLHLQRGQVTEAEEQFSRLVELAPDEPLGHANLGLTYLRAGRLDEAEPHLVRARRLDPGSVEIGLMLAKLRALQNRTDQARELLQELENESGGDLRVLYALAELEEGATDAAAIARYRQRLRQVLALAPANLPARLRLAESLLRDGQADSVVRHLEEVRRIPPEPPETASRLLDRSLELLQAGELAEAASSIDEFHRSMELTAPYQSSLVEMGWVEGPLLGRAVLTFAPEDFLALRGLREAEAAEGLRFVDATTESGLASAADPVAPGAVSGATGTLAVGDVDGDGRGDLFVSHGAGSPGAHLYRTQGGQFQDLTTESGVALPSGAVDATFADYDNDGWLDLLVIEPGGGVRLFRNRRDVSFEEVSERAGITGGPPLPAAAEFVDFDHDGDLDLVLAGAGAIRAYRNNLDGTFADVTAAFGLSGVGARDVDFADLDGDGRVDLIFSGGESGLVIYRNGGARRFSDVTQQSGIGTARASGPAVIGDLDNDGVLDLVVGSAGGGEAEVWLGTADGGFTLDQAASDLLPAAVAVELLDADNDGWLDIVAVSAPTASVPGMYLLHNEGEGAFADRSELLPSSLGGGSTVAASDVDGDGDLDLLLAGGTAGLRLLRNDGGNLNRALRIELKALGTGSGKNNDFGIGARLELRVGDLLQTRVVTSRATHFGLGPHLKADVLRVEWPNGVPQVLYFPGSDQDVLEMENLKGSCAFLYTWDGEGFRFVTDVMWRSALGMPLGLMGRGTTKYAPAGASREYLRIPGEALRPRDGRYVLQLTEELWETAYMDEVRLLAVDHPDSVDIFVDERFVPPGPVDLRVYPSARPHPPLSAVDGKGKNLLPELRDKDDVYVSGLVPLRYQGLVEPHDLILDLGDGAGRPGSLLVLRGWIYPTDASINVALAQQAELAPMAPTLEVPNAEGGWTMVRDLSFPSGKDKSIVVELEGLFPTPDHRVRIRTNLQIYWDQAFVTYEGTGVPLRVTTLAPASADLHYRGFSRMYRKGGRYGPHWFAYDEVVEESPWRPIEGAFTRFGDVLPLLGDSDDMYVVMAPGDEMTVEFDASSAAALPAGWRRDFLLYTVGWIKDADLNTAFGDTVAPLPFHDMREYPYAPGEAYPATPEHQRYLDEYNTRISTRR